MIDRSDMLALVGLALIFVGAWQIYPPVAFIICGATLLASAFFLARR